MRRMVSGDDPIAIGQTLSGHHYVADFPDLPECSVYGEGSKATLREVRVVIAL